MRCHYLSDLHLESQEFPWQLPDGDVLVIAGDLCHAVRLAPTRADRYSEIMRERVLRFADVARARFRHVLLVAGNHDHYDGVFGETVGLLRQHLPGITVLDDETVEIEGVRFFGATLWTDFNRRDARTMEGVRRKMGEYFFVKVQEATPDGSIIRRKFRPEDAADACERAMAALRMAVSDSNGKPLVVVTHHAPSLRGLNPLHRGNGADGAYASDLDAEIETMSGIRYWVHGHTHIRKRYRIGETVVVSNARGFEGKDPSALSFSPSVSFEL